jgi:hypothetical protein
MNNYSHAECDATNLSSLAAVAALRASLAESHGSAFADAFVADHIDAIRRAAKRRLNGRMDTKVRMKLHELRCISQDPPSHG